MRKNNSFIGSLVHWFINELNRFLWHDFLTWSSNLTDLIHLSESLWFRSAAVDWVYSVSSLTQCRNNGFTLLGKAL